MRRPTTKSKPAPQKTSAPVRARLPFPTWLPALVLALVTIALYWPATRHDFVNYDDEVYVTSNFHVQAGLTLDGLEWAFFKPEGYYGYWHPLTLLSHMLDCQLYGLKPWGHHLTSVLLHALNTLLAFLLLRSLTGAFWRSLVVAALFAMHPLHVESVAWVAERKDVLSTFFGMLTLICYTRYAQEFKIQNSKFKMWYGLALVFFACGLMSKPMLVTWPFVMLLLDWWPMGRFSIDDLRFTNFRPIVPPATRPWSLLLEKIPFFALVVATSAATFVISKKGGAITAGENLSLGERVGNALVSYCRYLGKLFYPTKMTVFYPHPGHWPLLDVALAVVLLAGITVVFLAVWRRYPFLLVGWLWFMGMLVPVIGLLPVGEHAMADRYTYVPALGIFILVVWGLDELARRWRHGALTLSAAGALTIAVCMGLTRQQLGYWQDDESLFRHALLVTRDNYIAHKCLGDALCQEGKFDEAITHYQEALRLKPDSADAHNNLGNGYCKKGLVEEAIRQFQEALRLKPDDADAHNNLGTALYSMGQSDEAIRQYREALRINPEDGDAHENFGNALYKSGQTDDAIIHYRAALHLKPDDAKARDDLGIALAAKGQTDEATILFQQALRLNSDDAEAHNNLGYILVGRSETDEAIHQFQEAIRLAPDYAEAYNNLGTIFNSMGRVDEAVCQFQEALRLKPDYAEAHNNLGITFAKKGQVDEAIRQFREALRLRPGDPDASKNLARALEMKAAENR